ncbi:centrosomal protein of 162 kDa [Diabrotica virgifera virgifera]|uniref:Centrosomal protein of 162 kDa n=1 Tax=Diabrotica virgifera virgifera TaxID=50390 RepID=A0A6P7G1F9_DIAVI|nr:centrosomal protein of 162 kDa [Diabrotica virgifera virgifera]
METKNKNFWWLKSAPSSLPDKDENTTIIPKLELPPSTNNLFDDKNSNVDSDVDVGSIIEEINRVAAQSPLGPYEKSIGERSVDDLIKEAEKIYMESSKSFEQLSQRSKTSQNLSDLLSNLSKDSTPTPKSVSPLPMDPDPQEIEMDNASESDDDYTEDFSEESKIESANLSPTTNKLKDLDFSFNKENIDENKDKTPVAEQPSIFEYNSKKITSMIKSQSLSTFKDQSSPQIGMVKSQSDLVTFNNHIVGIPIMEVEREQYQEINEKLQKFEDEEMKKQGVIQDLELHNKLLKQEMEEFKLELQRTQRSLEQTKAALTSKTLSSPEMNLELEKALENLKDSKEINTALQLQLDTVNKSHQLLKSSYDDLLISNSSLQRRLIEIDSSLDKYKGEILQLQQTKDKLIENEINLNKLLEMEKLQSKNIKIQHEKDAKCIQDLNRQIKEMERIIARKHPDSVSALIVAAKENATDTNLTARKVLEDRIKSLEQDQLTRETQSSKVFMEIQEKFNQMKAKYENHIEDLELHVSDLKNQLKRRGDTYDVYTQTTVDDKIPQKETFTTFTQTDATQSVPNTPAPTPPPVVSKPQKHSASRKNEDTHLLATIRGLQADLSNKEKVIHRLQKEIDDLKKTNRRLQKEREGSLKNLIDKKESKGFPERLTLQARSNSCSSEKDFRKEETVLQLKCERDKLKLQLSKLEEDFQCLQNKRIQDLTALQEAHEQEVANYMANVNPLREQLEIHQMSLSSLQSQLTSAREELAIVRVERDHLSNRLMSVSKNGMNGTEDAVEVPPLLQKIGYLEKQYVDREYRLRSMIYNLSQKGVANRSCQQCLERQQQLISYKAEMDQLLTTVRALQ